MEPIEIVVIIASILIVSFVIIKAIYNKKHKKKNCGCGCENCSYYNNCHK